MSKREWKPGDVWLINEGEGYSERERLLLRVGNRRWIDADGDERSLSDNTIVRMAHPLVVIDPEDREQVERLRNALFGRSAHAHGVKEIQTVLREFADPKPPKPVWTDGDAVQQGTTGPVWIRGKAGWARGSDYVVDGYLKNGTCRLIRRQSDGAGA